ncbi:MAG: pimeloyl-ACP methyl ester carboxylesterase [Ascidiaceihabitans sp.]|jgi:pimeloyl-ACP methyl ester carboxylesterase
MIKRMLTFIVTSAGITACIALVLIALDRPKPLAPTQGLDFTRATGQDLSQVIATQPVTMRDGSDLAVRMYGENSADRPLIILVHGSGWHGMQFDGLARNLADTARVLVPDLRGHGLMPDRRGDVDYIGQMEDDLADLIASQALPDQKIVMLGHSSGGGLVVRFAGGADAAMVDRAILLAPFLKYNAPTTRAQSGGWAHTMTRRIIGLSMLNTFGITALNGLPIIQFNMPKSVIDGAYGHTATTSYSYRLNASFAPRGDYLADVAGLPDFTLIVGAQDEAFFATQYEPLMSAVTGKGRYLLVEGVGHLAIVDAPETLAAIQEDLSGL